MFYVTKVKSFIRVPPKDFDKDLKDAVFVNLRSMYEGYISKELGIVVDVVGINLVGKGKVIPGDGAAYHDTEFELLVFKPELNEVVMSKVRDITDFGAFMLLGPIEGMAHISQTMDDFVSFSKDKVLVGKDTKRTLKANDVCKARIVAVSYKDIVNPKINLTMRQEGLGKLDWINAPKGERAEKKPEKEQKAPKKK